MSMDLSYWEYKTWLSHIDFTVVGSGIVGLTSALRLRERFPEAKILVLEKGTLPQGASTKNAGFACFGSISEILADLSQHSEEEVLDLVQMRWDGIQVLRSNLGDSLIDLRNYGGHEVFLESQNELYERCLANIDKVNDLLEPVFRQRPFAEQTNVFKFKKVKQNYITNSLEAQLDTGKLMQQLLRRTREAGISILNSVAVGGFEETGSKVAIKTDQFELETQNLLIATNGFASQLVQADIRPARAQVLITKPIGKLHIKGTFHLDEGYYYFRNIDQRILLGGGRNLDFEGEETMDFGKTKLIQNQLETMLHEIILPGVPFAVERRWSGIMGTGPQKRPVIKQLSDHIYCGVRLGGMGVAIGSLVGKALADLA